MARTFQSDAIPWQWTHLDDGGQSAFPGPLLSGHLRLTVARAAVPSQWVVSVRRGAGCPQPIFRCAHPGPGRDLSLDTDISEPATTTARNVTLADLAGLLRDQHARAIDIVAPATAIRARHGRLTIDSTEPVLGVDGVIDPAMTLNNVNHLRSQRTHPIC